jgi:hypothetical protein
MAIKHKYSETTEVNQTKTGIIPNANYFVISGTVTAAAKGDACN